MWQKDSLSVPSCLGTCFAGGVAKSKETIFMMCCTAVGFFFIFVFFEDRLRPRQPRTSGEKYIDFKVISVARAILCSRW